MWTLLRRGSGWVVWGALLAATAACGGGAEGNGAATPGATAGEPAAAAPTRPTVRTASEPEDPCGWIAVADVEAVVGTLAEPPKSQNGCTYTMVLPAEISAKRQEAVQRIEAFRARFKTDVPTFNGPMANFQSNPKSYAVSVDVDVSGSVAGELGMKAATQLLAQEAGTASRAPAAPPEGWDALTRVPYGVMGRAGHVMVTVTGQAPDVPTELMERLAAAVRDRVPDLPFRTENSYQVIQLGAGDKNPCDLLTRAEAEAVLGPLVLDPYRSSSQHPPLALDTGHGCAFFTKGHRVFVIVPTWDGGDESFRLEAGIGALIGQVMPEELVVFKGPWDKAQPSRGSGALLFLKGDRLLEVHYLTSSADRRAAVRLAATAMRRLAA